MRVLAISVKAATLQLVRAEGEDKKFTIPYKDEWSISGSNRLEDYVEVRKRLRERIETSMPDVICIAQLEAMALSMGRPTMAWFLAAELRGIVAEAACSTGVATEYRRKGAVSKSMGKRKAKEYAGDNDFWVSALGSKFPKKYRDTALLAVSRIREG
ncbi:hypothetical protein ACFL2F_00095 [Myxococcota bacterium]